MSEATVALRESAPGLSASAAAGMSAAGRAIPLSLMAALPGLVFFAGYDNLAYGLGLVAGCVLAGQLIAPRLAGQRATTVAEAIRRRFGTLAFVLAAAVIVLVVIPLLVAELTVIGTLAEGLLGLPYLAAVLGMLLIAAAAIFLPGERAFGWLAMAAYLLLAVALLLPLALMAIKAHGFVVPHLAQGQALMTIAALEEKLLESGLVDFDTFSAHTTPFLRLTPLNFIALVVSLALGIAVLPHFVAALAAKRGAAATRLAGAWTALFVMLLVITVPALAAYAKLEIYGAIAAGTKLSDLPLWLEAPSRAGLAHVHGTSVAMLEQLAAMPGIERADLAAASDRLALHAMGVAERWSALAPEAQQAVVAAARSLAAAPATTSAWALYVSGVLPAAAASAGNEAATLTQASLVLEPLGLLLALPALSGAPLLVAIVLAAGLLALGCVMMVSLTSSLFRLQGGAEPRWRRIAIALAALAVVGGIAALRPGEIVPIVVGSLSLSAAGLFPVLALGLAWKRATAAGAVAAILVGAGVTLYYDVGVQVFPAAFYKTWSGLSDAGEYAIEEFDRLEEIWREAEAGDEKAAAASALDDWARGTPTRPGLANWFGIDSAFGGALGAAAGLIALLLVSAATSRRRSTA